MEGPYQRLTQTIDHFGSAQDIPGRGLDQSCHNNKLYTLPNNPYLNYHTSGALEQPIGYKLEYKTPENPERIEKEFSASPIAISNLHRYLEKAEPIVPQSCSVPETRDTSVLFDILRKERQPEGTGTESKNVTLDHQYYSYEPREWDFDLYNMSLPNRKEDHRKIGAAMPIRNGDALNRLKKSATTQITKPSIIRTTKASRLRAAAVGM